MMYKRNVFKSVNLLNGDDILKLNSDTILDN